MGILDSLQDGGRSQGINMGALGMALLSQSQGGKGNDLQGLLTALMQQRPQQDANAPRYGDNTNLPLDGNQPNTAPTPANPSIGVPTGKAPAFNDYLATLKQNAISAYPDNPNMQKVALTQALLESGINGQSTLASKYKNLFGIKAPGTAGTVNMPTREVFNGQPQMVNAGFGANNTYADSFNQHRDLLNKPRYGHVLTAEDPYQAFSALQKAGYATDPAYPKKLGSIYNKYVAPLF